MKKFGFPLDNLSFHLKSYILIKKIMKTSTPVFTEIASKWLCKKQWQTDL